jgi:hypothetical protein
VRLEEGGEGFRIARQRPVGGLGDAGLATSSLALPVRVPAGNRQISGGKSRVIASQARWQALPQVDYTSGWISKRCGVWQESSAPRADEHAIWDTLRSRKPGSLRAMPSQFETSCAI